MTAQGDAANRLPITISIMLATIMNALDMTIANVALPHIQGSVSASVEQVSWVLTSYIVAAAIATPLTGWLADRIGRKQLFLVSIGGFTVASMLCGVSSSLWEIVASRMLQGMFGAFLVPLSQAVLLDINPREKHPQAMAIWSAASILGPLFGPAVGGFLTEHLSWRWVFFINLPVGILAFVGVWLFISGEKVKQAKPFDFLGFGSLILAIASFQLMLDRGPSLDWFQSPEIWAEALLAGMGLWVFVTHTFTAEHPFFDRGLARDRNFLTATIFGFFIGILLFSATALLPQLMQGLMGYPVLTTGLVNMPRGVGLMVSFLVVGWLIGKFDTRLILLVGLAFVALGSWQMTQFDLSMTAMPFMTSGVLQGMGIGLIFVPLTTLAFATLPPHLRAEGSSVFSLVRNIGSAVGISIMHAMMVHNTQTMHASMAERIDPSNPTVAAGVAGVWDLSTTAGLAGLDAEITRQASMVAYVNDFRVMLFVCVLCVPMLLILRAPKTTERDPVHAVVE